MNEATLSAVLLLAAGLLHSFSLMCRQLPERKKPAIYPKSKLARALIDLNWIALFFSGIVLAFALSFWLGVVAALIYFVVLPFVFQVPMARMLGFASLRDYLEALDRGSTEDPTSPPAP